MLIEANNNVVDDFDLEQLAGPDQIPRYLNVRF